MVHCFGSMEPKSPMGVQVIRFGTFEVDFARGDLRKRGTVVRIQDQPFRILKLLLEQPGEVISRDQIRSALWPDDTFVDFDHSLNAAVAKLRQVLGDSAENPRFVETVARRGYRFIAPVDGIRPVSEENAAQGAAPFEGPAASPEIRRPTRRWVAATLSVCVAAIAAVAYLRLPWGAEGLVLTRITADAGLSTDPAFSPDGRLIAYASDRSGGNLHIWIQEGSAGGQALQLTSGNSDDDQPSFSPDGSRIAFHSNRDGGGIYVVHTLGGDPVPVAAGGRNPRFSPDSEWIAYWKGVEYGGIAGLIGGEVYIVPSNGGQARLLSSDLAVAGRPVWSPDGTSLLVFGKKDIQPHFKGEADWWVIPVAGGGVVRTHASGAFRQTRINSALMSELPSPSGWTSRGVLFSARSGDSIDLWRIPIQERTWQIAGSVEQLTSAAGFAISGSEAPDGRVAFASQSRNTHVWSLAFDANSGTVRGTPEQLTHSAAGEFWPTSGGKYLAFATTKSGRWEVVVKHLETGKEQRLAQEVEHQEFPMLSADGTHLAYTVLENGRASVYVAHAPTFVPTKVSDEGSWVWGWSPDGRYLLMKAGGIRKVQLMELATRRSVDLLDDPESGVYQANFSSDGRWLTFMHPTGIFVAPFRGPVQIKKEEWIRVTKDSVFDDKPRWAPDGNSIYFTSDRDDSRCIWRQHLHSETKRPIGEAVPVYHSHGGRRSILNAGPAYSNISVTRNCLVFLQTELTGNVWVADWTKRVKR